MVFQPRRHLWFAAKRVSRFCLWNRCISTYVQVAISYLINVHWSNNERSCRLCLFIFSSCNKSAVHRTAKSKRRSVILNVSTTVKTRHLQASPAWHCLRRRGISSNRAFRDSDKVDQKVESSALRGVYSIRLALYTSCSYQLLAQRSTSTPSYNEQVIQATRRCHRQENRRYHR